MPYQVIARSPGAFIAVASPSQTTNDEWRKRLGRNYHQPPEVYQDYALIKVLYHLRQFNNNNAWIQLLKWDKTPSPLNFTSLEEGDIIYIVGHGDQYGIRAMGPNPLNDKNQNTDRLVKLLTDDGSLKKKSKSFAIKILLLSCRAGLGLHAVLAQKLYKVLGANVTVGGAEGFTFGSPRTLTHGYNEVLIIGLPWWMEYEQSIKLKDAEQTTSNREQNSITYSSKKKEIDKFKVDKGRIESQLSKIVLKLKSIEINKALNELTSSYKKDWDTHVLSQFNLYYPAKVNSNLEFDMWFNDIVTSYQWTTATGVSSRDVDRHLSKVPDPILSLTTIK